MDSILYEAAGGTLPLVTATNNFDDSVRKMPQIGHSKNLKFYISSVQNALLSNNAHRTVFDG